MATHIAAGRVDRVSKISYIRSLAMRHDRHIRNIGVSMLAILSITAIGFGLFPTAALFSAGIIVWLLMNPTRRS